MANKWPSQEVDRILHHSHRVTSMYSWIIILELMEFSVQETLMVTSSNFLCKKSQNNNICPKCTLSLSWSRASEETPSVPETAQVGCGAVG